MKRITTQAVYRNAALLISLLVLICSTSFANTAKDDNKTKEKIPQSAKQSRIPVEDVQRFSQAISHIKRYYVKTTDDKELFDDAIRGMLIGLDPHSGYLDEEDFKSLKQSTRGDFSGIGIEVTMDQGLIKVITPIDDTPAHKAGMQSGDLIVRIGKTPVKGLSLKDAVKKMRGKRGTQVNLLVVRKGEQKPLHFNIVRDTVKIKSVKYRLLENQYGYIRISQFQKPSGKDVIKAVADLNKQAKGDLKGLVLDLRNNPGGLLDSAIEISDAFIHNDQQGEEELIVYTKGRIPGSEFSAHATPGDILKNAPIVVLINEGSASGSEIVAGALKDNKRAVLVGTRSFGKGSVQTIIPLDQYRGIKLTTALYYTPKGTSIQAKGISPDIVIKNRKITEKKDEATGSRISEADLVGHLANGNSGKSKKKGSAAKNKKDDEKLSIYKDYQLYQALNLLKGMSVMHKQTTTTATAKK